MENQRVIFHIDVNSAFLAWTALDLLRKGLDYDPRDVPSVVGGDEKKRSGIVLAKSFPAKKYNIITGESIHSAKLKCPNLIVLPPSHGVYGEESKKFVNILKEYSPDIEQYSVDECFVDYTNMEQFFGDPSVAAKIISNRIKSELGFTVNIGISTNKVLAKIAGELSKPDKIHTLYPWEIQEKMWPLPVEELFMVGKQTAKKLRAIGIKTIGELARADLKLLQFKIHSHGNLVWNYANGIDDSPINTISRDPKSISISRTTAKDLTTKDEIAMMLLSMCETMGNKVRNHSYTATGVSLYLRDSDLQSMGKQKKLNAQVNCTAVYYDTVMKLLPEIWTGQPIRKVGIGVWGIEEDTKYQYDIWYGDKYDKWEKIDSAVDSIRKHFGKNSVMRCSFLNNYMNHMTGTDGVVVAFAPNALK